MAVAHGLLELLNRFNAGIFQELVSSRKHKLCLVPRSRPRIALRFVHVCEFHLSQRPVGIFSTVSASSLKFPYFIRNARLAPVV
jgi:hypothetical protein